MPEADTKGKRRASRDPDHPNRESLTQFFVSLRSSLLRVALRERCQAQKVTVPADLDIVVYCTAVSSFASARVAIALRKHGVRRVRLLEGGLNAWRNCQYPVKLDFGNPQLTLARCGIQIAPPIAPRSAVPLEIVDGKRH